MSAAGRLLLPVLVVLTGCASSPSAGGLEGRIWDVRAERFISDGDLVARLRAERYRLLGEVHDNPAHHRLRATLIAELAPTEVFLEQFDRGQDAALREVQRAGPDADALARAGRLDASWKWPLHRPIVQTALDARLPLRASRPRWRSRSALDAAIALALSSSGESAVLIAGNGHVRRDLGVPVYLPRDASIVSVGFLETRAGETEPRAYARGADGDLAYDYIWFTAPHPRPDPCEAFGNR